MSTNYDNEYNGFVLVFTLLTGILMITTWIAGIVLAKGIVSTIVSSLFLPYAWYLVIERIMQMLAVI